MVEGSTTTGERRNGIIMRCFIGEGRLQPVFRLVLLSTIVYLFRNNSHIIPITGLVLFGSLCICSSTKNLKISFIKKIKYLLFSNRTQRSFMDVFLILLWLATILPLENNNFLLSGVLHVRDIILLLNDKYGLSVEFADIDTFHFIFWDIVVIVMSIILAKLYEEKIFSTIDEPHANLHFSDKVKKMNTAIKWSVRFMLLSLGFFLFKIYFMALLMLIVVAGIFIYNDRWLIDFFESISRAQEGIEHQQIDARIAMRIKKTKESLYFANIPTIAGLTIMFCISVIFKFVDVPLTNGISLTAFIAGGSAMHMIFGNLIVLIILREDDNFEGVRE